MGFAQGPQRREHRNRTGKSTGITQARAHESHRQEHRNRPGKSTGITQANAQELHRQEHRNHACKCTEITQARTQGRTGKNTGAKMKVQVHKSNSVLDTLLKDGL